jgi:hypothetical protein
MKKKRRSYSVDAVIRFFLQYYNIPTKQDIEKLMKRMERLEAALKAARVPGRKTTKAGDVKGSGRKGRGRAKMTATEKVISVMNRSPKGIDIAGMKKKTGFEDKRIRNIVFRLTKQGTIKRTGRGVYTLK